MFATHKAVCRHISTRGGEGGGEGAGNRVNYGTGVRASISKPTPFIYLAFKKKKTHSYT